MNHKAGFYCSGGFPCRAARTFLIFVLALVLTQARQMAFSAHAGESRRIETEKQNGDRGGKSGEADEQEEEQTEPETDDPQEVDGGETEVPQKQEAEEPVWEIVLSDIHPEVPE